ncbi:MAG: hypothetical protein LUC34_02230 [Campylobacter sp.]|nr:hypothetical protein [Campylobacter sp.]
MGNTSLRGESFLALERRKTMKLIKRLLRLFQSNGGLIKNIKFLKIEKV